MSGHPCIANLHKALIYPRSALPIASHIAPRYLRQRVLGEHPTHPVTSAASRCSPRTEGRTYTSQAMVVRGAVAPSPTGVLPLLDMAIYSFRAQVIGRSSGRSATAAAAYRSGEEIRDERTGKSHDYTGKSDIYDSEILLPENAPERLGDRTTLWNEVEAGEKRKDARLSREIMVALPAELTHAQKQQLTREFVRGEFTRQGMIADIGYHDFDSHNPHAHIMLTMRTVDENGFGKKNREWDKRALMQQHREAWANHANRALERAGYEARIDHRSLKEQGIEREPQIHLGAKVLEMEARGIQTRVGDESRRISKVNRDIERKQKRRDQVRDQISDERTRERAATMPAEPSRAPQRSAPQQAPSLQKAKAPEREPLEQPKPTPAPKRSPRPKRKKTRDKDQGFSY